ncbi:hypothetical protein BH10CYA1_BH10CYA1_59210 [soil metagenome]
MRRVRAKSDILLLNDRPIQKAVILWVIVCAVVVAFHPADLVAKISKMMD